MGSKVNLKQWNTTLRKAKNFVSSIFDKDRIQCVIIYGSSLNKNNINPKDIDILILLDKYECGDMNVFNKKKSISNFEFFIDYKDQILRKGINNYQRGRHGAYFFKILAYGKCIIGSNFYLKNINKVSNNIVYRDLLFRIEEYFYRIQKHFLNNRRIDIVYIKKYILRIILDILLYYDLINFTNFNDLHYTKLVDYCMKFSNIFSLDLLNKIRKLDRRNINTLVPKIVEELYNVYLLAFDQYNDKFKNK